MTEPRFVDNQLGYLLGQAHHALFKAFEAAMRAAGLSSLEWRVLAMLNGHTPIPVGTLAQVVLSQQPTLTKLVQRLAASAWVRCSDDPCDPRRSLVHITAVGRRKEAPLIAQARHHESHGLAGLSSAGISQLKNQLRQLAQTR